MTDTAASTVLSEEAKRGMDVLREAMISICYIYDNDFCNLEKLHKSGAREEKPSGGIFYCATS